MNDESRTRQVIISEILIKFQNFDESSSYTDWHHHHYMDLRAEREFSVKKYGHMKHFSYMLEI